MKVLLKNGSLYTENGFVKADIIIDGQKSVISFDTAPLSFGHTFDISDKYIFPGFTDVHVHFREPGFSYKETIASGSMAAAKSGYCCVATMPNLSPVPDSLQNLKIQLDLINKDAKVDIIPFGSITKGENGSELSDMQAMSPYTAGFSDDGRGVQSDKVMKSAMEEARSLGKIIAAHCEDDTLCPNGIANEGVFSEKYGYEGISNASEYIQLERDLKLCEQTGCAYHLCHASTKESVELIREAKQRGLNVSCETAPHYLILSDDRIENKANYKMKPPIRSEKDRIALIEGIKDGTIDMIATDHAPHSDEEKSRSFLKSPFGVVGLETAFPVLYTYLVREGVISLEKLISLMSINPQKRFFNEKEKDSPTDSFCIFDINTRYMINSEDFVSSGKSTPFEGMQVYGKCIMNIIRGKIVFTDLAYIK